MDFSDCFINDYINEILLDYLPTDTATGKSEPKESKNTPISFCKDHIQIKTLYCTYCKTKICSVCNELYHLYHSSISQYSAKVKSRDVYSSILDEPEMDICRGDYTIEYAVNESNIIDINPNGILKEQGTLNVKNMYSRIQCIIDLKQDQICNQKLQYEQEYMARPAIDPVRSFGAPLNTRSVPVHSNLSFGKLGCRNGEFYRPWGICVSSKGHIIVSDSGNNRVQIFDKNGNFIRKFGSLGKKPGQFIRPTGVAITPDDNIVVADSRNYRIQLFTLNGKFLCSFGQYGQNRGEFGYLWDVTCDSSGNIFVVDPCNCTLQKFTQTGKLLNVLKFPFDKEHSALRGICVTPSNQVIVTDYRRNNIFIVDAEFQNYNIINLNFSKRQRLHGLQGVVCDKSGNIIVSDSKNSKIKAVDMSGKLVYNVPKVDLQPCLDRPNGLCLTPEGRLAAVDFGNCSINIW